MSSIWDDADLRPRSQPILSDEERAALLPHTCDDLSFSELDQIDREYRWQRRWRAICIWTFGFLTGALAMHVFLR